MFRCITPDLLHQVHKGLFGEHVAKWAIKVIEGRADEVDQCYKAMPPHPSLQHFKHGISATTQWTGKEYKDMEKTFLGVIAGASDLKVVCAVRANLDHAYYAHFERHSTKSLDMLQASWRCFHQNKDIFKELGVCTHFNISKLHNVQHYAKAICSHGCATGFNTEASEWMHIDTAKIAYESSSKKEFHRQMVLWLTCQEQVQWFAGYLEWATPKYFAELGIYRQCGVESGDEDDDVYEGNVDKVVHNGGDTFTVDRSMMVQHMLLKTPTFPALKVASLPGLFGVEQFLYYLSVFLQKNDIILPDRVLEGLRLRVYKKLMITSPGIPAITCDVRASEPIWANPPMQAKGVTRNGWAQCATKGRFSTVLIHERPAECGKGPLDSLCVAQVHLLFRLPKDINICQELLACMHWFTPFKRWDDNLGMYKVT